MKLKLIFVLFMATLLITGILLGSCTSASAVTPLETTYNLYRIDNRSRLITTMTIFNQIGTSFRIQGDRWDGSGNINGMEGYYDWRFLDGKTGRTTFTVQSDGSLIGHVQGSGINWVYIAIPQTKLQPLPEPKQIFALASSWVSPVRDKNNPCQGALVAMTYFCGGGSEWPYVCCPKEAPYLNHCDCKCYSSSEFDCKSYSHCKEQ
jgi:hypothetical protein